MRQREFRIGNKAQPRHVRIEQKPKSQVVADDGSWAVSYSDMLMVLMSFFIIFFSFEDEKKSNIITIIAQQIDPNVKISTSKSGAGGGNGQLGGLTIGTGSGAGTGIGTGSGTGSRGNSSYQSSGENPYAGPTLAMILQQANFKVDLLPENGSLVIHMSDSVYAPRQFAVEGKAEKELISILQVLQPYTSDLSITFIGHSDKSALKGTNKYFSNNVDLSSLRASRALSYAHSKGFSSTQTSIEAMGSVARDTRSLSIKVSPKTLTAH